MKVLLNLYIQRSIIKKLNSKLLPLLKEEIEENFNNSFENLTNNIILKIKNDFEVKKKFITGIYEEIKIQSKSSNEQNNKLIEKLINDKNKLNSMFL